jgi:hypothetical protein
MKSTIYLRAHTETPKRPRGKKHSNSKSPKWSDSALVFDCETTTDEKQSLTFGSYRLLRNVSGSYREVRQEGLVYPDNVSVHDLQVLKCYAKRHTAESAKDCPNQICVLSLREFVENVFLPHALAGTLIVGFNLPFDISRIAADVRKARRLNEDWSFVMCRDTDPGTGKPRDNPFRPRIKVTRKDGKFAFIRLSGISIRNPKTGKRLKRYAPGRFLDLRTLAWALRNVSYNLRAACKAFGVTAGKMEYDPTGRVTPNEIAYCRQDVRATVGLLNALREEFDCHPIDLKPERAYSPASIAKAYLRGMGVIPPAQKFRLSPTVQGIAAQAYFGGRAEARIRRTVVPVVHTDFKSEYPTVNVIMGLWQVLTARRLRIKSATPEVRKLLDNLKPKDVFIPAFWKQLLGYALVVPDGDILPVRTCYSGEGNNVGVNLLTSTAPIWFALPDVIASTLLTGKPPKILRAFRVVPEGKQKGLQSIALRGKTKVDPRKDDFFKVVIESRERAKRDKDLSELERQALAYFLKILANAGSYGLFIETTPKRVPDREKIEVFSGESRFHTTSPIVEDKGSWYCPVISSLITAAGRLMLATLERTVVDAGGFYLFCDTDSMAIVANKEGGLIPCAGGSHRLPDGREAVKGLSWIEVQDIVSRFEQLNPYAFRGSILKVEKESLQRELYGYAVSTKRYCLFTRESHGVCIEAASSHGLGHLFVPKSTFDVRAGAPIWVVEAWDYLVRGVLELPTGKLPWFEQPAMMRIAITTPEVLKTLQAREENLSYGDRVKPFNFILSPQINRLGLSGFPTDADPERFTLIAPFTNDRSRWNKLRWINVHDGTRYTLAPITTKEPFEASAQLMEHVILLHQAHTESKSLAPDGTPCDWQTKGLLLRTQVTAHGAPAFIGKETDRRWEQEEDISMLLPVLPVYRPNETARLVTDADHQNKVQVMSVRKFAKASQLSPTTVQAIRDGHRIRKSTARRVAFTLLRLGKPEIDWKNLSQYPHK